MQEHLTSEWRILTYWNSSAVNNHCFTCYCHAMSIFTHTDRIQRLLIRLHLPTYDHRQFYRCNPVLCTVNLDSSGYYMYQSSVSLGKSIFYFNVVIFVFRMIVEIIRFFSWIALHPTANPPTDVWKNKGPPTDRPTHPPTKQQPTNQQTNKPVNQSTNQTNKQDSSRSGISHDTNLKEACFITSFSTSSYRYLPLPTCILKMRS
jgi:hypothetical protein